jgi:hypothetical protein
LLRRWATICARHSMWLVWFRRMVTEAVTGMGEVAAGAAVEEDIDHNGSDTMKAN